MTKMKHKSSEAYIKGFEAALHDFVLTGPPHRTTDNPFKTDKDRINWSLGRVAGFQDADQIIHPTTTEIK